MMNQRIRILAVDDDSALLAVFEAGLRLRPECDVTAVGTPEEALAALGGAPFDLVVTDYSLAHPSLHGLDVLRAAQEAPGRPLVVVVTAFATLEITLDAIKLGCWDFLTKPFQLEELQLVVRNAIDQIQGERERQLLRDQLRELLGTVAEMEQRQGELIERLRQLEETWGAAAAEGVQPAVQALNGAAIHDLQPRQTREKLSGYARMADTLIEQARRERNRLDRLRSLGILDDEAWRSLDRPLEASRG